MLHRAAHESSRPRSGLIARFEDSASEMFARVPAVLLALGQAPLLLSHGCLELALVVERCHEDMATLSSVRVVAVVTQDPSADRVIVRVHPWHGLMVDPHRGGRRRLLSPSCILVAQRHALRAASKCDQGQHPAKCSSFWRQWASRTDLVHRLVRHTRLVRIAPRSSWSLSEDDPADLTFALYVRDACGLRAAGDDVPPLTPEVPTTIALPRTDTATLLRRQWDAWWTALLTDRSTAQRWYWAFLGEQSGEPTGGDASGGLLPIGAELSRAQQEMVLPARRWRSAHPVGRRRAPDRVPRDDSLTVTRLVEDIESEIGHQARAFDYRVEVVPVQGRWFQDLSANALLVSEGLITDSDTYRDILRPRLTALAQTEHAAGS